MVIVTPSVVADGMNMVTCHHRPNATTGAVLFGSHHNFLPAHTPKRKASTTASVPYMARLLKIDVLVVKDKDTDDGEGESHRKSHKIPHGISPVFASSFPCAETSACVDTRASHYPFLSRRIFVAARAGIKML